MRKRKNGEFDPVLATWGSAFIVPIVLAILLYVGHRNMPQRIAPFLTKPIALQMKNIIIDERLGLEVDNGVILLSCKEGMDENGLKVVLQETRKELALGATDLVLVSSFDGGRTWPIRVQPQKRHLIADKLRSREGIISVGFNTVHRLASVKRKSAKVNLGEGDSWGLSVIKAREAWKMSKGANSRIAFVDSGALTYHPALKSKICYPYSLATLSSSMQVGSFVTPNGGLEFVTSHGTHLSVLACGDGGNQFQSIAPEAQVIPLQALWYRQEENEIIGGAADLVAAIRYAIAAKAHVICIGTEPCIGPKLAAYYKEGPPLVKKALRFVMRIPLSITLESFRLAIDEANKARVIIVKAAGNQDLPAWFDEICLSERAITVGAINKNLQRADFSNYGKEVTVSAPGVDIKGGSANPDGTYGVMSGTSVAAAHVASVIALMKAKNPKLTFEEVRDILLATGQPVTTAKDEAEKTMGPLVNAQAALTEVMRRQEKGIKAPPPEKPLLLREGRPVLQIVKSQQSSLLSQSKNEVSSKGDGKGSENSSSRGSSTGSHSASDAESVTGTGGSRGSGVSGGSGGSGVSGGSRGDSGSAVAGDDKSGSSGDSSQMAPLLDPTKVYVTFNSSPSGAKVYCFDLPTRYIGKTPITFGFIPGTYRLKYDLPGFEQELFTRTLKLGDKPVVQFELKTTNPSGGSTPGGSESDSSSSGGAASSGSTTKGSQRGSHRSTSGLGSPEHANKMAGTWVELPNLGKRHTVSTSDLRLMTLAFQVKVHEIDIKGVSTDWSGPFHIQKTDLWFYETGQEVLRLKPDNTLTSFRGEYLLPHKGWTKVTVKIEDEWAKVSNKTENVYFSILRLPDGEKLKPLFARATNQSGLINIWGNLFNQFVEFKKSGSSYLGYTFVDMEKRNSATLSYKLQSVGGSTFRGEQETVNVFKRVYPVSLTVDDNRLLKTNEKTKRQTTLYRVIP